MTHSAIFNLLRTLDIPVAFDHFDTKQNINPPFIVYREQGISTFKADSTTYYRPRDYEIELVTLKKDVELENRLEDLLSSNSIPYDCPSSSVWDSTEKIYHSFYEI